MTQKEKPNLGPFLIVFFLNNKFYDTQQYNTEYIIYNTTYLH